MNTLNAADQFTLWPDDTWPREIDALAMLAATASPEPMPLRACR
jgi:hypothetical protein